ncbi:MAG TPA: CPBP family intramembrane glutamic endopeptidase [Kofleriaceae bacterium]|nr:CPBP family intramembrane glutamic endopeptidase [Kofleriaceae bacterium]
MEHSHGADLAPGVAAARHPGEATAFQCCECDDCACSHARDLTEIGPATTKLTNARERLPGHTGRDPPVAAGSPGRGNTRGMSDAAASGMTSFVRRHRVLCFLVITYAVTWGAWIPLAVTGRGVTIGFAPWYLLGLLGPLVGAVATTALVSGGPGLRDLISRMIRARVGLRWWGIALGLPLAVAAVTYVVITAYSVFLLAPVRLPSSATLGRFNGLPITSALGMWVLLVLVNGFGEEAGWRGFLLPHLARRWSPLVSSLVVGAFWATWHVPAFWISETYRQMPAAMIPVFFVGLLSGAVFLAWLYNRGGSSILLVAVWHGTFNLLSGSVGARGAFATAETAVVMVIAAVLIIQELRAGHREHAGRPAHHVMTEASLPAAR